MREQSSIWSKRLLAGAVLALVLLLFGHASRAGEPIQFSNDKTKPVPSDPQQPVDTDMFKTWKTKRAPSSPLNVLTPFVIPGHAIDGKEERRLKNAQDERKNWMLLEPGELQKREEQEEGEFGGKGVAIDKDDSQDRNYLFYNITQQRSERAARPQNARTDTDDQQKKDKPMSIFGSREGEKPGAHTASELNLKNLIDPAQVNSTKINNNEASLFQFLKDNAAPPPDRDQQARRDNFRDFLNGQPNAAPGGASDPINFRTDLTQERLNPVAPNRPAFDMSAPSKAPDGFSTRPPLAVGFAPPGRATALPDIINAQPRQPMPGPALPSPYTMQETKRPVTFQPQRRGGI